MEQGKDTEDHVAAGDHRRGDLRHLLDVGQQGAVGQHRGPGTTRRAARVEQHRQALRVQSRRTLPASGGDQLVPAPLPGGQRGADRDDPRARGLLVTGDLHRLAQSTDRLPDRGDRLGIGDHHPGARVGQHPDQLTGGAAGVDGDHHHAGPERTQVGRDELDPVAGGEHHPVARDHARVGEALHHPIDEYLETAAGHGAPGRRLGQHGLVRLLNGRPAQQRGDVGVHRASLAHRPPPAARVEPVDRCALSVGT